MNATLIRATNTNDADYPRRQVHITSILASQHTCNVQESHVVATIHGNVYCMEFSVKFIIIITTTFIIIIIIIIIEAVCARHT